MTAQLHLRFDTPEPRHVAGSGVEELSLDDFEPGVPSGRAAASAPKTSSKAGLSHEGGKGADCRNLSRRSDPASSKRTAREMLVHGVIGGHEAKILRALRGAPAPLSAKEIASETGLTNVQVCRRLGRKGRLRLEALVVLWDDGAGGGEQTFSPGMR